MAGRRYRLNPLSIRETSTTYSAPIVNATVTVYLAGGTTLATCYADTTTATPLSGSQTTTNSAGYFEFYVDASDYATTQRFKIKISKTGYTDINYDNLVIVTDFGYDKIDTINSQNNYINNKIAPALSAAPEQQLGLYLVITGGSALAAGIFRIPLAIRAVTGGATTTADGLDGINIVMQQNAADAVAYLNGIELSINNLKRNDPLDPVDANHYGMTIDVYGGYSTGPAALAIRTAAANSTWQRGVWIPVNSITPSTGYAFAYDGNGSNNGFKIKADATVQAYNTIEVNGVTTQTIQFAPQSSQAPFIQHNTDAMDYRGGANSTRWLNNAATTVLMYLNNDGALGIGTNNLPNALLGQIVMTETTAPGLPAANHGTIFMEDNGAGKTRLMVQFPSGAKQVIATEP